MNNPEKEGIPQLVRPKQEAQWVVIIRGKGGTHIELEVEGEADVQILHSILEWAKNKIQVKGERKGC